MLAGKIFLTRTAFELLCIPGSVNQLSHPRTTRLSVHSRRVQRYAYRYLVARPLDWT